MDRLQGFSLAAIMLLTMLLPLDLDGRSSPSHPADPIRAFSIAVIEVLSLLLPFTNPWLMGPRRRQVARFSRAVWIGELIAAVGGLWVIVSPVYPEYGAVVAVIAVVACLILIRRRRPARLARV